MNFVISNQPTSKTKTLTYQEYPVFDIRLVLPIEKVFESTTEPCKKCNGSLTRVITDLRPACDGDGHYLGHYTLGSYLDCLACNPKLKHRVAVPCAMWCHPRKRPRKKNDSTSPK